MAGNTIILFWSVLLYKLITSGAVDTIRANQTIRDGDTIISARGEFELGFFSPGSSTKRYLGIWYKKISHGTVIWVANGESPLANTTGVVRVNSEGITVLTNCSERIIWASNLSRSVMNPTAQLLDTGNLVLRDEKDSESNNFLWQSFDYPGNNFLPDMKFGLNLVTGLEWYLTSWKSNDDPSSGSFTNRLDPNGLPQILLWNNSVLRSRTGPWVGSRFSGNPYVKPNAIFADEFTFNQKEIYYKFTLVNVSSSPITRVILTPTGEIQRLIWNDRNQNWMVYATIQVTDNDRYGLCGAYGSCNLSNYPPCECLTGFEPKFPKKWEAADWSDGCVRKTLLDCGQGEGFMKYSGVKFPDTRHSWYNMSMNLHECEKVCIKNCNCTAYANADTRGGGSGCLLWLDDLVDIKGYTEDEQDIYVRMPTSELGYAEKSRRFILKRQMQIIVIPVVPTVLLILFVFKKRIMKKGGRLKFISERIFSYKNEGEDFELPLFDFKKIANATNNFSHNNKLGEGGFGPVYKGMFDDGQEIAVKMLSDNSRQGEDEFKNEISCIAKLQHRNLVTLLGCCTDKGERILIYEYMPNKSLDSFIFDEELSKSLDWPKRYNIINGIARGLLYLHQDSKLRIIHRDIKASNILLDHEMNPKISDFGMARSFGGSQTEANTTTVVGTYGYMPPEYASDGLFSVKSDVYSFGVLVIEIVSGKKNRLFSHPDHSFNLLGHAWRSYKEDELLGLIDGTILKSSNHNEVFRVIQIGLLCVQQYPEDRPSMSYVVLMLSSNIALPHPKQPGFFTERKLHEADYSLSKPILSSANQLTITFLAPRL